MIESVQKRFSKRLSGMAELQYSDRLKLLGTESLEQRRLKSDLCMYYKIMFQLVDLPVDNFFVIRNGITRNNGLCIYKSSFRLNSERYFFRNRCINSWNLLPFNVVNALSINNFKRGLSGIDFRKFLKTRYDFSD
jgi:hypothetical protein